MDKGSCLVIRNRVRYVYRRDLFRNTGFPVSEETSFDFPYKKFWYKWHHILGVLFGLFVLTFCFSGMMSFGSCTGLGVESQARYKPGSRTAEDGSSPLDYPLDYRAVVQAYPGQIRQLNGVVLVIYPLHRTNRHEGYCRERK